MAPSTGRAGFGAYNARPNYYGSNLRPGANRRVRVWRNGIGYSYFVPAWIGPGYYPGYLQSGYGFDSNDFEANVGDSEQSYDSQPVLTDQPEAREPYTTSASPQSASPVPQSENAVTLVFKDGRPSQEIHNYALTRTTLYVLDEQRRDIPVADIDLSATEKTNRDAGVDFQLPVSLR